MEIIKENHTISIPRALVTKLSQEARLGILWEVCSSVTGPIQLSFSELCSGIICCRTTESTTGQSVTHL